MYRNRKNNRADAGRNEVKDEKQKVVGRAGYKLGSALKAFSISLRGKTVLDIGSSTGGFTEAALRNGARHVLAIEKGTKQMKAPLRFDPRIDLREKTDIFNVVLEDINRPDVIVGDVSFVSLAKVLAYAKKNLARKDTEFIVMLKPQFEAKPWELRNGIVKNNKIRREIIVNFEAWLRRNDFLIVAKRDNELAGRFGNVERFYYLKLIK